MEPGYQWNDGDTGESPEDAKEVLDSGVHGVSCVVCGLLFEPVMDCDVCSCLVRAMCWTLDAVLVDHAYVVLAGVLEDVSKTGIVFVQYPDASDLLK